MSEGVAGTSHERIPAGGCGGCGGRRGQRLGTCGADGELEGRRSTEIIQSESREEDTGGGGTLRDQRGKCDAV